VNENNLDLLTTDEVARLSRRARGTIYNRIRLGLPPHPVSRGSRLLFRRADVLRWLGLTADDAADADREDAEPVRLAAKGRR
jgi:predicted DNA-binding transcriptional regulator AlpA